MFSRPVAFMVALCVFAACRRTPEEPHTVRPSSSVAPSHGSAYRPSFADTLPRIVAALHAASDASTPAALDTPTRLELQQPDAIDVIAVHMQAPRSAWIVAAVEPDRVTLGLAGAERCFNVAVAQQHPPDAIALARLVGAFAYYPWPVFDGAAWSETGLHFTPEGPTGRPQLVPRQGGTGRALVFTYAIPDGQPGAGIHLAHFRVTDSNYLIDEAPDPSRR